MLAFIIFFICAFFVSCGVVIAAGFKPNGSAMWLVLCLTYCICYFAYPSS